MALDVNGLLDLSLAIKPLLDDFEPFQYYWYNYFGQVFPLSASGVQSSVLAVFSLGGLVIRVC